MFSPGTKVNRIGPSRCGATPGRLKTRSSDSVPWRSALSGARFSTDRLYRYALWRIWDRSRPWCNFLMLCPSTADEATNDPTIERCQRRAGRWGFGGLVVTNLFAFRTTDPFGLRTVHDPIGPQNDAAVVAAARDAALVICAWGAWGSYLARSATVQKILGDLGVSPFCLGRTKAGEPAHPLYLSYSCTPVSMNEKAYRPGSGCRLSGKKPFRKLPSGPT